MNSALCALARVALTGVATLTPLVLRPQEATTPRSAFAEPTVSPDRSEIAFVSGGDIWTVPSRGGEARLLVSHAANESRPLYSPDGRRLAFVSTRSGNGDIYVLTLGTGELRRLTFDDAMDQVTAWSGDSRWLYFQTSSHDISSMNDMYRVRVDGGTPMPVSADRYANEFFGAPAPDGKSMAVVARGFGSSQWWRKGRSHLDESELWLVRWTEDAAPPQYERLTAMGAKQLWPMWSPDGRTLYFMSDRSGVENIWARDAASGQARQITKFTDGRVLWPSISADGKAIVFERDFAVWSLDPATGEAHAVPITLRGASAGPAVERLTMTNGVQEMALSPDGKKVAFVMHGEVFAASSKDGGDGARVTWTPAAEGQLAWAPDSRRLVYASSRDGPWHLYLYDFASGKETRVTAGAGSDVAPRFSPDGKLIAFTRDGKELRAFDVESKQDRQLAEGTFGRPPFVSARGMTWSPDSRWLAYLTISGAKQFQNAWVVPAAGGSARAVSFLANSGAGSLSWSPDGTYLLFDSRQRTEDGALVRIDLVPRTPRFREDQFRDLFREELPRPPGNPAPQPTTQPAAPAPGAPPAPTPARDSAPNAAARRPAPKRVDIAFEDIRRRLSLLPVGVDVGFSSISPDGKQLAMIAGVAGQQNLYTYSLDELARETPVARQLTSTAGPKELAQWSPDGKEIFYVESGRISVVPVDTRTPRQLAVQAEMDVDFAREKMAVFAQGWGYLHDNFFDPAFNGVNWAAERERYAPFIEGARTPDEMRRLMNLMVGDLNASHSGIGGPPAQAPYSGRIGLSFDRAEYERNGKLRITGIVPLSPAALSKEIALGSYLQSVDGTHIDARTNLDSLLAYTTNRRVVLTIADATGGSSREVVVRPVSTGTEKGLLYRAWVEERRALVDKLSGGRLGYVHMFDMGAPSLAQLYLDLDVENQSKDGVVVDVRSNNGGFVNAYALDVLARRPYLVMTARGRQAAPARPVLGQRALEAPTVLVTNQHSLSDAEDFTEGYRALGLGKVVGEPTAGWIIYTSGATLLDGTTVRIPFTRVTTAKGEPMEMHPRPVDVLVERGLGESYLGRDGQLEAAVRELLKR
jgi:tricorn protease